MGTRFLFIGTLSLCVVPGLTVPGPQTASGDTESCRPSRSSPRPQVPNQTGSRNAPSDGHQELAQVFCISNRAHADGRFGMDVDKVPAASTRLGQGKSRADRLTQHRGCAQQQIPGIIISDTTGNPFQPDIHFAALLHHPSPVRPRDSRSTRTGRASTKAFGDTVNWT